MEREREIHICRDKKKEKDRKGEARARRGGRGVNSIGAEDRPEASVRVNLEWAGL